MTTVFIWGLPALLLTIIVRWRLHGARRPTGRTAAQYTLLSVAPLLAAYLGVTLDGVAEATGGAFFALLAASAALHYGVEHYTNRRVTAIVEHAAAQRVQPSATPTAPAEEAEPRPAQPNFVPPADVFSGGGRIGGHYVS